MDEPLLRTKLHRPPLTAETLRRPRLHRILDRALELPLTLVSAPAGYGKSTLVSDWAESLTEPSAWLSLDTEDSDLGVFARYLLAAIRSVAPDACAESFALSESPNQVPVSVLAGSLANELEALESRLVLVVDDYHRMAPGSDVHQFLRLLLAHPPRSLHLVLATRSDPPLPIASLRGAGRVAEVRLQDLRFTRPECAEYVERSSELSVSEQALANLELQTEGWIVALRLVSIHLRQIDDPETFLRGLHGGVQQARDYLLLEVLATLPDWTREWMLKTALLDRFCAPLCDAVCDAGRATTDATDHPDHDGQRLIEALTASNLFVIPLDVQGHWFRYHHLFQEMLRDQLETRATTEEIAALHLRASQWFEHEGLIDEALRHSLEARDTDLAVQLVARHRHSALDADRWYVLAEWLSLIPDDVIQQHAELLMARAWVLLHHFRFDLLSPLLDQVEPTLADDPAQDAIRGEISFCRGYILFFMGEGQGSLKHITEAVEQIPRSRYEARAQAEIIFALSTQMVGQKRAALRGLDKLLALYDSPTALRRTRLLITYVFIDFIDADLMAADAANQRLRNAVLRREYAYVHAWTDHMQGLIHLQRGEWEAAVENLGRSVAQRFIHFKRAATDSIVGLMLALHALGRAEEARSTLQLLHDYVASMDDPALWPLVSSAEVRLAILEGRLGPARSRLDSTELPPEGAMLWWLDLPSVTRCRALIAEGSQVGLVEAATKLSELLDMNVAHHNASQQVSLLTLSAMASEKQGRTDEALGHTERALTLAQRGGLVFPFLELGPAMTALLRKLPRTTTTGRFVAKILATAAQDPEDAGPAGSATPPVDLLTNREQEILELLAERLYYKEIAARLFISSQTVNSHLKNVYQKLGVSNRRQAVTRAAELGLLPNHRARAQPSSSEPPETP